MFRAIKEKLTKNKRLLFAIVPSALVLALFLNSTTLKSFSFGFFALIVYLTVNGELLGNVFFSEESHFFRFAFGLLMFIIVIALMGMLAILLFPIETWYLVGMIFTTIAAFFVNLLPRHDKSSGSAAEEKTSLFKDRYVVPIYGLYVGLFFVSFFLLFKERSGWIVGPIWNALPPIFLQTYFITTAVLVGILLLPGRHTAKLLLICLHSTFSLSFLIIILYPGIIWYDPWIDLARGRIALPLIQWLGLQVSGSGLFRVLNNLMRGFTLIVIPPTVEGVLNIDLYWVYVLLMPVMWGFFVPLISYRITRMIGGEKETSILAAFLTTLSLTLIAFGKLTAGNSLGNLFFLFGLYLLLRFLSSRDTGRFFQIFFPIMIGFAAVATTHLLPTLMFISCLVLAFALKKYEHIRLKNLSEAYFLLCASFILSALLLPLATIGRGIVLPMIGTSAFSVKPLLSTSIWTLVFGVSEEYTLKQAMLYEVFQLLVLIGFIYTLHRKMKFSRTLCLFLFLVYVICFIDYRILSYCMVYDPYHIFGPGRLNAFRDMAAIPFAAVVINSAVRPLFSASSKVRSFFELKDIMVGTLIVIILSSWSVAAIYETYRYYTPGLLATSLEVDVVKYIDEHTNGKYVVLAPHPTAVIGWGFVGLPNLDKHYVSNKEPPSVAAMFDAMRSVDADIGYYIVSSFRGGDFNKTIAQASRFFGVFEVFTNDNGMMCVFYYRVPPLPRGTDVMAFHWDTPSSYNVQNHLMRVKIDTERKILSVEDFWGDLYESLELDKTLVDGKPVGNVTSIEYLHPTEGRWVEWDPDAEISPTPQFQFRLRFENDSLIGVVEREKASVELNWQSGRASTLALSMGHHTRLYIPGLIDGKDSYDVNSRKYGFLYTESLTDNVLLHPANLPDANGTFLTFDEIQEYCDLHHPSLTSPEGYMWYDLFVHNNADVDQWAFIEARLPDEVYMRTFPPLRYSIDNGKTWVFVPYNVETMRSDPMVTVGRVEVNWIMSKAQRYDETPTKWTSFEKANGGFPLLPENFTDTRGAENRIIYGLYLPARDKILVRLGASIYWVRPLEMSYVFNDSEDISYGLQNMEENLVKFYSLGTSQYVGGFTSTSRPLSLTITQDETNELKYMSVTIPANTVFSLLSSKGVNTSLDADGNGVPDEIEG